VLLLCILVLGEKCVVGKSIHEAESSGSGDYPSNHKYNDQESDEEETAEEDTEREDTEQEQQQEEEPDNDDPDANSHWEMLDDGEIGNIFPFLILISFLSFYFCLFSC